VVAHHHRPMRSRGL